MIDLLGFEVDGSGCVEGGQGGGGRRSSLPLTMRIIMLRSAFSFKKYN